MSGPLGLIIAPRARADYKKILIRSGAVWGPEQQERLAEAFDRVFEELTINPEMGRARDELSRGLRSFYVQHHLIYYRIRPDHVRIARILHERQSFRT